MAAGLCPYPLGELTARSPDPLAGFGEGRGSEGGGREKGGGKGRKKGGEGRKEGKEREGDGEKYFGPPSSEKLAPPLG